MAVILLLTLVFQKHARTVQLISEVLYTSLYIVSYIYIYIYKLFHIYVYIFKLFLLFSYIHIEAKFLDIVFHEQQTYEGFWAC